jgi:hypothetical protein
MVTARPPILIGWPSIASFLGVHPGTAKAWHALRPLPIWRDTPKQQPRALPVDLEQWVREGRRRG